VRIEHSLGYGQQVSVQGDPGPIPALARALNDEMLALVDADRPLQEEWWTVEEARETFSTQGWDDAARLLRTWRMATCRLVSYGQVRALRFGPLVHRTGLLTGFCVMPQGDDLLPVHGTIDALPTPRRSLVLPPDEHHTEGASLAARRVSAVRR